VSTKVDTLVHRDDNSRPASPCEGRRHKLSRSTVPSRSILALDFADNKRGKLLFNTNAQRDEAAKKKRKSSRLSTNKGSRSKVDHFAVPVFLLLVALLSADCASFC
jgi:hypothetical protein